MTSTAMGDGLEAVQVHTIEGALAAVLGLKGFHPSRPRPRIVWTRGRRYSGRRVVAILEHDGSLMLHRQARRAVQVEQIPDAANRIAAIGPALQHVLSA